MWGVAKDELVLGVEGGGALPDHLNVAKPGLQRSLHVLVTPLLYWCPLPPTYSHSHTLDLVSCPLWRMHNELLQATLKNSNAQCYHAPAQTSALHSSKPRCCACLTVLRVHQLTQESTGRCITTHLAPCSKTPQQVLTGMMTKAKRQACSSWFSPVCSGAPGRVTA